MISIDDYGKKHSFSERQIMDFLKRIKENESFSLFTYFDDSPEIKKKKEGEFKLLHILENTQLIFLSEHLYKQTLNYEKGYEEAILRKKGLEYLADLEKKLSIDELDFSVVDESDLFYIDEPGLVFTNEPNSNIINEEPNSNIINEEPNSNIINEEPTLGFISKLKKLI